MTRLQNLIAICLGFLLGAPKQIGRSASYIAEKTRVKLALDDIDAELQRPDNLSAERINVLKQAKAEAELLLQEGNDGPGLAEKLRGWKVPQKSDPVERLRSIKRPEKEVILHSPPPRKEESEAPTEVPVETSSNK